MTDMTLRPCPCGCARLTVEQLGEGDEYLCVVGCFARGCTRVPGVGRGDTPALALARAATDWNRGMPGSLAGQSSDQKPGQKADLGGGADGKTP